MTLRISLRNGEKMIVNGAVLRANGRADLVIENQVSILRGRDVMSPHEANTAARRLYHACMMAYVDEAGGGQHRDRVVALLGDLMGAFESDVAQRACMEFARLAAIGDYYRALGMCRTIIDLETEALERLQGEAA